MENTVLYDLFNKGLKDFNINLSTEQFNSFMNYKDMVIEWNNKINLTSITDDDEFIVKHFIDSLSVMPYLEEKDKNLIDIGTGAGFPGIPLKILNKDLEIKLLDSLEKRVKFLDKVISEINLEKITTIHSRAEDAGNNSDFREIYFYGVSRAVASLPVLLEYCLPFIKTGGTFFAMKGSSNEEISQSKKALSILGGEIIDIKSFDLPTTDNKRNIIIVKKVRQTPTKYPRKAGKPSKEPL